MDGGRGGLRIDRIAAVDDWGGAAAWYPIIVGMTVVNPPI